MATIEILPLADRLSDEEIAELAGALEAVGAPQLPKGDEGVRKVVAEGLDDDTVTEFMDRLEAHDIACELYLPIEFEGRVNVGDFRAGSLTALLETLAELKDDFNLDREDEDEDEEEDDEAEEEEDDEEEDEDDEDYDSPSALIERRLQALWKVFSTGARKAHDKKIPLHIKM